MNKAELIKSVSEKAELTRQVEALQNTVTSLQQELTAVKSQVEPEPEQQTEQQAEP